MQKLNSECFKTTDLFWLPSHQHFVVNVKYTRVKKEKIPQLIKLKKRLEIKKDIMDINNHLFLLILMLLINLYENSFDVETNFTN